MYHWSCELSDCQCLFLDVSSSDTETRHRVHPVHE